MSDDIEINDDGDIVEEAPKRDAKGRFIKGISGNSAGRGKGKQSKLNKVKMVTALNKHGIASLEAIVRIAKKAEKDGQLATSMKGHSFIAEKYLNAVVQQEKLALELEKLRKKAEDDNDDEQTVDEVDEVIFNFQRAENE